jgi:glucokinase
VGATNVRVGVGDNNGRILKKIYEKTDKTHGSLGLAQQIIRMIHKLQEDTQINVLGIGIGSIGPLDLNRGAITNSPNIPFKYVPLREPIANAFDTSVILLNDCNAAVVGERLFGAGKGFNHLVYITLSTGIGGGAFVDGHLLLGKDGNASEVGHIVIDVEGRLRCGCGKKGHWEAYCSGKNIPNYARMILNDVEGKDSFLLRMKSDPHGITTKLLFEEAEQGDQLSLDIVDSIGRLNATAFASLINIYDPSIIIVGGALALKHGALIINPITRYISNYVINRIPEIVITPLREDVVLLGAMATVYHPNYAYFKS